MQATLSFRASVLVAAQLCSRVQVVHIVLFGFSCFELRGKKGIDASIILNLSSSSLREALVIQCTAVIYVIYLCRYIVHPLSHGWYPFIGPVLITGQGRKTAKSLPSPRAFVDLVLAYTDFSKAACAVTSFLHSLSLTQNTAQGSLLCNQIYVFVCVYICGISLCTSWRDLLCSFCALWQTSAQHGSIVLLQFSKFFKFSQSSKAHKRQTAVEYRIYMDGLFANVAYTSFDDDISRSTVVISNLRTDTIISEQTTWRHYKKIR